jgi:hypothetical protein
MESSTRFLSLSGLAGVFAGLIALAGGAVAYFMIFNSHYTNDYLSGLSTGEVTLIQHKLIIDAFIVLVSAVAIAFFFSYKKASLKGLRMWTPVAKRLLVNMLVPLTTGGILIVIFFLQNHFQLIIPSMLIFYGLALVNAGKFTYSEVFYLGIFEIITGLVSVIMPQFGLFFWLFGFGLLHISYGLLLYRKYEK